MKYFTVKCFKLLIKPDLYCKTVQICNLTDTRVIR